MTEAPTVSVNQFGAVRQNNFDTPETRAYWQAFRQELVDAQRQQQENEETPYFGLEERVEAARIQQEELWLGEYIDPDMEAAAYEAMEALKIQDEIDWPEDDEKEEQPKG